MDSWILVYAGNYSSVLANQATLEASGIRTFIPDSTTKVVDPVITGGSCLDAELHVQIDDVEEAEKILNQNLGDGERLLSPAEIVARDPSIKRLFFTLGLIFGAIVLFILISEFASL